MANKLDTNISGNDKDTAKLFGELLKKYRKDDGPTGISQKNLAEYCGVTQPTISAIENGIQLPGLEVQDVALSRYSLALDSVREQTGSENEEALIVTQIKTFLDSHPFLSQECLMAMKASFVLFARADTNGDLGDYFPSDTSQKIFQSYGWDFTLRIAMDEFKKQLGGRVEYDRVGIIRRKLHGQSQQECFISAEALPLFTLYDKVFRGPGAFTKTLEPAFVAYNEIVAGADPDIAEGLSSSSGDPKVKRHWFWHVLRDGPREESLLFVTRGTKFRSAGIGGIEDKGFSLAEQDLMSAVANRYIQEVIGIADTAINYR